MKILVIMCSVFLMVTVSRATEREFLHGQILQLNRQDMVMTVQLGSDTEYSGSRDVTVLLPANMVLISATGQEMLPACLFSGNHVRIWGTASYPVGDYFRADAVRGCGMAACNDPTGVRSRLFRKRNSDSKGSVCR